MLLARIDGRGGSVTLAPGRYVAADSPPIQGGEVLLRAVAAVRGDLARLSADVRLDLGQELNQLRVVVLRLRRRHGHDDLMLAVDRSLAVVRLLEAVLRLHDPAVGIGEVALRLRRGLALLVALLPGARFLLEGLFRRPNPLDTLLLVL